MIITRGINSRIGRRAQLLGSGAAVFSPLSLFANGEEGAWYDPSDLTTLYQDSAGTTPVTADGDPVGYMGDKSGNGNHATQSTSAARPVYRTDGTLHWLAFDGVDDWMATAVGTPLGSGMAAYSAFAAFELNSESSTDGILAFTDDGFSAGDNVALMRNRDTTGIELFSSFPIGTNEFVPSAQSSSTLTPYILSLIAESGGQSARLNGTEYETGTVTQPESTPVEIILGAYTKSDTTAGNLKIFSGLVINRTLTAGEISGTEAYFADKSGVTL